ncbi:uncharacterized protein LOC128279120 [Anopheles cruzii]|uniref:uncharacterized protein LOC128279120 n=1 Tax=Anopheles cruzii TaxID=68878 RepID=UPI0022EC93F4|nr:uncharacterized protein LOC128279120 [Anopheles cruzii]
MSKFATKVSSVSYLRPPVPPEKKWFYKQVLASLETGGPPHFNLANSTLGRVTSKLLSSLVIVQQRAQDVTVEYQLKEKLSNALVMLGSVMSAVKNFVTQRQYYHIDRLIDRGLLTLEDKLRVIREQQLPSIAERIEVRSLNSCAKVTIKRKSSDAEIRETFLVRQPKSTPSDG